MSVLKPDRKESKVQFMESSLNLVTLTIKVCKKFPKSITFYVSVPTVNAAKSVYNNLKRGNSIIPTDQIQAQKRLEYFELAKVDLQVLSSEMDIACEMQGDSIAEGTLTDWFSLLDDSIRLVNAQIKNDKVRFKGLPL